VFSSRVSEVTGNKCLNTVLIDSEYTSQEKNSMRTEWPSRTVRLLKVGPIRCPETSVRNYHSTLRNILEERRSHLDLHRGERLNSRTNLIVSVIFKMTANSLASRRDGYKVGRRLLAWEP
jgi:hypothetical protein